MNKSFSATISNKELLDILSTKLDLKFEELNRKIDTNIEELNQKLVEANLKITELKEENSTLKQKVNVLEKKIKSNNVVIFGLNDIKEEKLLEDTVTHISNLLNVNITDTDIGNIYRPKSQHTHSPIVVQFTTYRKKYEIFQNINKLKGTGIFIRHDMTQEEREINSFLREKLKEATSKNHKARIKGKNLIIDGKEIDYATLRREGNEGKGTNLQVKDVTKKKTIGASEDRGQTSALPLQKTPMHDRPKRNTVSKLKILSN